MEKSFNGIYSAKKNYFASGAALCLTAFGYAFLMLSSALGMYTGMSDTVADIVGSLLVQVVLMLGISITINIINEYKKPKFKVMELSGSVGLAIDERNQDKKSGWKHHSHKILESFRSIGFRLPPVYMWPLSVLIGVLFIFFTVGVSLISVIVLTMLGYNFNTGGSSLESTSIGLFLLGLFLSAVLPAVCEEILHRGVMVKGLKENMSDDKVVVLTAIIFGLAHAYIGQTFYTFAGGLILAIMVVRTGSIFPAMIVHFINNGFSVYMEHAKVAGWWGYAQYNTAYTWLIDNIMLGIILWLLCVGIIVMLMGFVWLKGDGKASNKLPPKIIRYDMNTMPYTPDPFSTTKNIDKEQIKPKYRPLLIEKVPLMTGMFLLALMTIFSFVRGLF